MWTKLAHKSARILCSHVLLFGCSLSIVSSPLVVIAHYLGKYIHMYMYVYEVGMDYTDYICII